MVEQSVSRLLAEATACLAAAGIPGAAHEARLLAAHALEIDQAGLLRAPERQVEAGLFRDLLARRVAHEPMAYVLGTVGFWTLSLEVSRATLIPRADSETLIEAAIAAWPERGVGSILDLGTGTGCLLLAALTAFPGAWGVGVDRVAAACTLAWRNARANGLSARAAVLCGDWADAVAGRFDLVLCNPPYIASAEIDGLMPEVGRHEPHGALDGGADGLAAYRSLVPLLPRLLAPGGRAILELGAGQAPAVTELAAQAGLAATTRDDLGGHARALMLV